MFNNLPIDNEAFLSGCRSVIKEGGFVDWMANQVNAGGGGFRDKLWNGAARTTGKFLAQAGQSAMDNGLKNTINEAGSSLGSGAISGATKQVGNQFTDLLNGAKEFGSNMLKDPMKTMKDSPWASGALGAGILGAGYFGGKALGMWGENNQPPHPPAPQMHSGVPSNGVSSPPPMMQSAYTPGYTPMALNKAGGDISLPTPLLSRLAPSLAVGSGFYQLANANDHNPADHREIVINPGDDRTNNLLKNPKMRAYLTSLVNSSGV